MIGAGRARERHLMTMLGFIMSVRRNRSRIAALISVKSAQLLADHGASGAMAIARRRMAFCAHAAQGPRWMIWQKIGANIRRHLPQRLER